MSKRRRSTTTDVKEEDDDLHTSPTSVAIKRRKRSVNVNDAGEVIQELYDIIRNYKNAEGRLVCEALIRIPKRRTTPEYYEVVSNPIDMLKIQQRIKTEEYDTVDDMVADVELMVNNAQAYYEKTSKEHKDAIELWTVFLQSRRELMESSERKEAPAPTSEEYQEEAGTSEMGDDAAIEEENRATGGPVEESGYIIDDPNDPCEILFSAIMGHRDVTGRIVSLMFRKLPRQHEFPAYYEIIDNPIDLCDIAIKIRSKKYDRLADLDKDLCLMVKNAKQFNEPGSQIYKDAVTLKKIMNAKKAELERQGKEVHGITPKQRRPSAHGQSAITEALNLAGYSGEESKHPSLSLPPPPPPPIHPLSVTSSTLSARSSDVPSSTDGDDNDDDDEGFSADSADPLHVLFNFVLNFRNNLGQLLSEPFMRLPNSRIYPDYYREIKKPIALTKIRSKLKTNKYKSLDELGADLELMFQNAYHYNMPSSQLYKDAEKLHKAMQHKRKEVEKIECIKTPSLPPPPPPPLPPQEEDIPSTSPILKKEHESEDEGSEKGGRRRRSGVPLWKTRRSDADSTQKPKMMALYQTLVQYKEESGRSPITLFMEKPSKKEYPDYYHIITEPIDMKTIESNIKNDKYQTEEALMKDFALMFDNARHYNEEGSMVYEDANLLEALLKDKFDGGRGTPKSIGQKRTPVKRSPAKTLSPLAQKLNELFNAIKNYTDQHGRELSPPFIRLPSKNEYPEYYQVIKRPMDMQRIQQKIISRNYDQLEDMVNDFLLMFDNACKFNEPDSLIYKDALTLQRILLQTKTELMGDETSGVPDIQGLVREILTSLFVSVANHQDEEGRCYSDSLAEIPVDKDATMDDPNLQKKPLDLDTIRRYLDRGCYRRLDCFQDHIFFVLERARQLSRTDSQVYEDSIELQRFFIQIRDEICKNGEILLSPALSYTHRHLQNALDIQKKEKIPKEMKEDNEKKEDDESKKDPTIEEHQEVKPEGDKPDKESDDGLVVNGVTYRVGDFVYVEPSEKQLKNHIVCIEKLWRDADGETWLHGNWFLRPNETFHLATRKFLEMEVFKSDYYNKVKISQHVLGKCFVMFVKDYFKHKPEGFEEDDVFVCESRYSAKAKAFKKIKIWAVPQSSTKIINRDEPLSKVRVESVFAGSPPEKPQDTFGASGNLPAFDKERECVMQEGAGDGGLVYYEQIFWNGVWYKLGDAVYIKTIKGRPHICRMDKIWKIASGETFFFGPVFIHPSETVHPPTKMFYQNEVFLSCVEESYGMVHILGKCALMLFKDYICSRPTEFAEKHVYVCESQYKDMDQSTRKVKGLKRHNVSNKVIDDEIYFFKKPITPVKEPSPLLQEQLEVEEEDEEEEEEEEDGEEIESEEKEEEEMEIGLELEEDDSQKAEEEAMLLMAEQFGDMDDSASVASSISTPKSSKKKDDSKMVRNPSAFILFASENRAACRKNNPEMTFGDISRSIGQDWRNLSKKEKQRFENMAAHIAATRPPKVREEKKSKEKEKDSANKEGGNSDQVGIQVYECGWDGCDFMFEEMDDLVNHVVESSGHLRSASTTVEVEVGEGQTKRETHFLCCWKTCTRFKKNQPFPVYSRLVRHCKEVHMKHAARFVLPHQLSRNYHSHAAIHGPNAQRPSTPGSSAVMGVVGPPTPVGMATQQINQSYGGYGMPGDMYNGGMPPPPGGPHGSPYQHQPGMPPYQPGMHPQGQPYTPPTSGMHPPPTPHMGMLPPHQQPQGMMQPPYGIPRGQAMSPGAHSPAHYQGGVPPGQQSIPAQYPPMAPPQPMFVPAPPKTQRLLHSEAYIKYIEGLNNKSETISDWKQSLSATKETVPLSDSQKQRLPRHWFAQGVLGEDEDLTNALWKMRDIMQNDFLQVSRAFQFETPGSQNSPPLQNGTVNA